MNASIISERRVLIEAVRRIAALEYALIEACHTECTDPWQQAQRIARAGAAQVHLFDLGTALRELGDDSLSYSRCVRHALLQGGKQNDLIVRLQREYVRLLDRKTMPDGLRVLLRANALEHRQLDAPERSAAVSAAA